MPVKRWFAKATSRAPRADRIGQGPLAPLARPIALTHVGMVVERGLRAFWPLLSLLALIGAALAFALPLELGLAARWFWLVALLAVLATLGWGVWKMRWPRRVEAIARLDATLPGRPLSALTDDMALGGDDPGARALGGAFAAYGAGGASCPRPAPRPRSGTPRSLCAAPDCADRARRGGDFRRAPTHLASR
jgi:hypothetical protein